MPSLSSLPATWTRRGLLLVGAAMLALTTGCDFILGVPHVDHVDVSVTPDSIPAASQGQAIAVVHGNGSKIITGNTKVTVGFASSNNAIAVVNPSTGVVTAVAPGTVIISATARGKTGQATVVVMPEAPRAVQVSPPTLFLNSGRVRLVITPLGASNNDLGARPVQVGSTNNNIVTVENSDGTTTGVYLRPVNVGSATVQGSVQGVPFSIQVSVQAPVAAKITGALQKGSNTLLEGESNQIAVQLFAADGTPIPITVQGITFKSNDQTVAVVDATTGVVTGVRQGSTTIEITASSTTARGTVPITVTPKPARAVLFQNRSPFIRLGSNGTGAPSIRQAFAFDSANNVIPSRVISYKSTDPTVFTVSSLGLVIGQKLGTALLVASADSGAIADTISLTVTPMPIVSVVVNPLQASIQQGGTQQLTATLTDSVGVVVSGRAITWQSTNPTAISVDGNGLVRGIGPGTATITASTPVVTGLPGLAVSNPPAQILVLPVPIATIDVNPPSVSLKIGQSTLVQITPRDASGTALPGRSGSITVTSENPGVAFGDNAGNIRGVSAGTVKLTYQAYDTNGIAQGAPAIVTVTVN